MSTDGAAGAARQEPALWRGLVLVAWAATVYAAYVLGYLQ